MTKSKRLLVIVPYRDREEHRRAFVPHITALLKEQGIPFKIVFVEQEGDAPFNRGLLANVGFDLYGRDFDYLCVHDVDIIGENFDYSYSDAVTHLSARQKNRNYEEWYPRCIGGATLFPKDAFLAANGYSGSYWGWGAEDDDLRIRLDLAEAPVQRRQGRYDTLSHQSQSASPLAQQNAQRLSSFASLRPDAQKQMVLGDGLSDVKKRYKVIETSESDDYTSVLVSFRSTVCLSMIVKNETAVLSDCLNSVSPHIDYWVIVDTGSTDGTQDFVRDFFAQRNIPGELHERPWVDFGSNRSEALLLCDGKADHAWMIDADDRLVGNLVWPEYKNLRFDTYTLRRGVPQSESWRRQVFRTGMGWCYKDVLHEYAYNDNPYTMSKIEGDYYIDIRSIGCRSAGMTKKEKYLKDAEVLKKGLEENPENLRYQFYLGQSYLDAEEPGLAFAAFGKRVTQGGWHEEVYQSFIFMAAIAFQQQMSHEVGESLLLRAWNANPARAEPLVALSKHFRDRGELRSAYLFARQACQIPYPNSDIMFINSEAYRWQALDELASTAHAVGDIASGIQACEVLLKEGRLPDSEVGRVKNNYKVYVDAAY